MTRLEKELRKRGIIGCADDMEIYRTGIDWENELVSYNRDFFVVARFSNVLDPTLCIYDSKTFEPICEQLLNKNDHQLSFCGDFNPWESYFFCTEEEFEAQFENC